MHRVTSLAIAIALVSSVSNLTFAQQSKLEKVVVTAAGFEQTVSDAPASISVIDREELEKKSYNNIMDAVKNIPGVYVTGGGNSQDISIRGMTSSYTLYLVDGRPISAGRSVNTNGADSGKQIGLPPISMIERVEVIRGPMSSLYGSEAMGGVINIITRKPSKEWTGTIATEYTHSLNDINNDQQQINLFTSGAIIEGLLSAQINASFQGHDESDFIGGSDAGESTPESKRKKAGAKLIFTPNETNEFGLSYDASRLDYTKTPGKSIALTAAGSNYQYDKDVYVLSHNGKYENWTVNTYLQHDVSEKVQAQTKKEEITIFDSHAMTSIGNHVLTFGGRYKDEEFVNETNALWTSGAPGGQAGVTRWIAEAFTEVDWSVTDKLNVTTGLRYNDDELFGGHVTPRIYGVFNATDEWTIKGGVSTGYKQPTLAQATPGFGSGTGGGQVVRPDGLRVARSMIIGNDEVDPETSTNVEVGFVYTSNTRDLTSSFMVFHTTFEDKISEDRYCDSTGLPNYNRDDSTTWICNYGGVDYAFLSKPFNIDEAELTGAEFTINWGILDNLRLNSSYTFTDSEQKSGEFKGQPLNKSPEHMFNANLDYQVNDKLALWTQANYRGKTTDYLSRTSMASGTPAYHFVDLGLTYKLNSDTTLKAGVYNVTNREVTNENYGVVLDGRRLNIGLTLNF